MIVATPPNYDPDADYFDTSSVEKVITQVARHAPASTVVIKSTISVGFARRLQKQHPESRILFAPEFLRGGRAMHDRIIVADPVPEAEVFAGLLLEASLDADTPALLTAPRRRRRSSCSRIPTWPCAWPTATSFTPSPAPTA